jgi:SAM-dependent methyltransferase
MRCCVCNQGSAEPVGALPDCTQFAGLKLDTPLPGGELWRCGKCSSMFRYPTLKASRYLSYYENAPGAWEGGESQRRDYSEIYAYLAEHCGGSILDIGCFTGGFLAGLPDKFVKYGVEPSQQAAAKAKLRHIDVLGKTLSDLAADRLFDVVVAIDVVEHTLDVEAFLRGAMAHVDNDGLLIVSTGNPESFFWRRIFKSRYWYCAYPEHVVFPSHKYFALFARGFDLGQPQQIRFKYANLPFHTVLAGFIHQVCYAFIPQIYLGIMRIKARKRAENLAAGAVPFGGAGIFTDHQLVIFRKRDGDGKADE